MMPPVPPGCCACCTCGLGRSLLRTKRDEPVCCRKCQRVLDELDDAMDWALYQASLGSRVPMGANPTRSHRCRQR